MKLGEKCPSKVVAKAHGRHMFLSCRFELLMSDKRQRARVQGSWAKPLHKPQQPAGMTTLQTCTYYNTCGERYLSYVKDIRMLFVFNDIDNK